jgi:hypothetical protein
LELPQNMHSAQTKEFHEPQGFLSLAKNVGIKDATLDLTVIYSTVRARAAAMFPRNRFPGAPVIVGKKHIANGFAQALVINSKNANVAMGKQGIANAIETCRIVGEELGIDSYDVLPFSIGVIGRPPPMEKIRAGLRGIKNGIEAGQPQARRRSDHDHGHVPQVCFRSGRLCGYRRDRQSRGLDLLPKDEERKIVERANRLERFLTQPFHWTEPWTNLPGVHVPLTETLAGCSAILRGECDDMPEEAFYFVGNLETARRKTNVAGEGVEPNTIKTGP